MQKRAIELILVLTLGVAVLLSCGGSSSMSSSNSNNPPPTATGSVAVFGSDAPICDVISFQVTITGATLTPQGGGTPVSILSSTNPITVDFARLVDFTTLLSLGSSVPAGTYSELTLTLSNPQLVVLNVTSTPPAPQSVPATLTTSSVAASISPPLVVNANASAGLAVDFSLRKSVQTDANGQVTGTVDPILEVSPAAGSGGDDVGDFDDLHGLVQTVNTSSSNSAFTGSFTIQIHGGVGPVVMINTTSSTDFEGASNLSALTAQMFVGVQGHVDGSGNIIADEVDVEAQEASSQSVGVFLGRVMGVTRDSSGNATSFTLFVQEELPDLSSSVPLRSGLTVTIPAGAHFWIRNREGNQASFQFDPGTLGLGEEVAVHGIVEPGSPATLSAYAIALRRQTVWGNFNSLLTAGSDGVTGGFTMTPCGAIFQGKPITVLTFAQSDFSNVSNLIGLGPQPTLAVRGLLFYQQTSGSENSATWTGPTWVLEARKVHQLPQ